MKNSTRFVATLHALYIIFVMYLGPWILMCINPSYVKYWLLLFVIQYCHWKVFKGDCVLSYMEKKLEDNTYKLGSRTNKSCTFKVLHEWTGISYENQRTFMEIMVRFNILTVVVLIVNEYYFTHKKI